MLNHELVQNQSYGLTVDSSEEAAWIAASQQGDTMAFNRLVLRWEKAIYNLSLRMLQNREEAAEIAQEVFLSAFRNIQRFRKDAKFSTWLYRIAVNHCITRLRKKPPGIHLSLEDDADDELPRANRLAAPGNHEEDLLKKENRKRIRQAMESLPPEQRIVIELKFFQELKFEEISAACATPLSTIKSRLYAGLETLKIRLVDCSTC
jgi:RNA polymerase sigma-70 factor (ECF subfamily)